MGMEHARLVSSSALSGQVLRSVKSRSSLCVGRMEAAAAEALVLLHACCYETRQDMGYILAN
jgi:hypothetical protein